MSIPHRVCREQVPRDEHMEPRVANFREAFGWLEICRREFDRLRLNKSGSRTRWLEQFAAQLRE